LDFGLTSEQRALRERVVAFGRDELGQSLLADDEAGRFPREDWRKCASFGVLGWPVPELFGGGGLDPLTTIIGLEALGYGCADNGLVFAVNNHLWGCAIYLLLHGTEQQKRRYLPGMCDGSSIGAHAMSEPEVGSDVLSVQTTAERRGSEYLLSGKKWFVSNGQIADVFVTFARTGGEPSSRGLDSLSAFVVTSDLPGFEKTRVFSKSGLRTDPMGAIEFDGCRVPAENLLGREGAGYLIFVSTVEWERAFMFASHVGAMERLLDEAVRHASSRRQFGRSIGTFQAVGHRVADMKIRLELARLILYRVGWLKSEGRMAPLDSSIAKVFISESFLESAMAALEIHGARGYLTEYGVERQLRDALGGRIYAGTSDVQRGIIAELLGLPGALSGEAQPVR
jgi:alkylation response protein AidB-like acyl-CoA dehydrogenase